MSNEYPQPVEPMSRAEAILRGNETVVPMSRIEDLLKQLIAGGGGGSTVTITTDYQTGTKIATLTIDGTDYNVYIPTDQIGSIVSITTDYQSGTKIATLTIDDTNYNIYIPQDQVGAKTYKGITDPASSLGNDGDIYYKCEADVVDSYVLIDPSELPADFQFEGGVLLAISLPADATKIKLNCYNYGQSPTEIVVDISDIPVTNNRPYSQGDGLNVFSTLYMGKDSTHIYFEAKSGVYVWVASGYFDIPEYSYTKAVDTFTKTNVGWIRVEDKDTDTGNTNYSGTTDPTAAVGNDKDLYFKLTTDTNSETLYSEQWTPRQMGTVIEVQYSDVVSVFDTVTVNIHNIGDLTFNYSDLPVSDDPATDGYTWHDEWNFTEFKISRDDTNIYFTITRWEGTGTWIFFSCSISYSVVTGISDCFIKLDDWKRFANEYYSTTERVVSIWVDGSPIYQITHFIGSTVTLDPSNWYEYAGFDASVISNLIDIHCFGQENGDGAILDSKIVDVGIENSHLQFLSLRNGNDFISGFTIKYTKVTT